VSVDTYAKKANITAYQRIKDKGVEILVSKNLASRAAAVLIEQKKFLFFKWLSVRAQLYGHAT
jgi:predicted Fe-Mo cluster-binding NifX family protein